MRLLSCMNKIALSGSDFCLPGGMGRAGVGGAEARQGP